MTLVSLLGKYDRKLKKYCRKQLRQGDKSSSAVWITDNFRLLSSSFLTAKGYISRNKGNGLLPLFFLCKKFFSSFSEITEDRIIAYFSSERLDVAGCEALPVLMFAAVAAVALDNAGCDEEKVSSCVKNLFTLQDTDFSQVLADVCRVEKYLSEDPSGIYEKMSDQTKRLYRKAVMEGAECRGISEGEYAKNALYEAREADRHIGFYLPFLQKKKKGAVLFIALEWLIAAVLSAVIGIFSGKIFLFPLIIFPVFSIIKPFTDRISASLYPSYEMLKTDEKKSFDCGVVITVSAFLPDEKQCERLYGHLAKIRSAVSHEKIKVLFLADKKNSDVPERSQDREDTECAKGLTDRLNKAFGGGFVLAVRDRVYSSGENEYTGFERKRGAITALVKYLRAEESNGFSLVWGDTDGLSDMKYILALDSDTGISFEALRGLLAAAEHPLNEPVYSPEKRRIVSGFGILTPRVETSLASSKKTLFARIFTNGGSLSYSPRVNERSQDMFGESIFSGKGLINIDAFNKALSDRLDNGRILSHDILEGNVLRTGFVADSELTDSFPSTVNGYYSRLHRWIRGDVQNLKYLFFSLGDKVQSPSLSPLGKYQAADNFRRAFTPVIAFFLMLLSCLFKGEGRELIFAVSLLCTVSDVVSDFSLAAPRVWISTLFSRHRTSRLSGIKKAFIRAVFSVGALPSEAVVRLDAIIRAFYRSIVSKKHLLQWKTAADADSEKAENIFIYTVFPLLCFVFMLIAGSIVHRLFALCFLVFIVFLQKADKEISESRQEISEKEREKVLSWAEKSWQYFSENVTAEENFLPPDNIQEEPVFRVAHRTSPTNIGLYLVSALAAADMKIIGHKELLDRVSRTIDTVEGLPKYKGLLYNWYDTVTAEPLKPYYLSSVDCGNFLVCLVALKEGLEEYGKYDNGFYEAKKRTENIIAGSDLAFLFDEKRQLFRIGFDCEKNEKSPSCYDLYMCEARMSSYYACGKRLVPAVHWGILDRALKRRCRYTAAASWSGTMFEYFMPALFLPHPDESFSREGLEVCLYMQRKTARKRGTPYGISESCCYSIDPSQNYRYKAHGIKALALKPDCFDENAVSPYSTFLSLPFDKNAAIKNLELLSSCNATGRYGFYEAVDFCKGHTGEERYKTVRCFMAHHIGMSITAAANALCDDIFVRRFISDGEMASAVSLLEEKLPFPCDLFSSLKESFTEKLLFPRKHNKTESDVYKK